MESFIKKFSTLPHSFIEDFYIIAKESYNESDIVINFDHVVKWLDVRKNHLKEVLVKHFEEGFDYTSEKKQKVQINSTGRTTYYEILITPNCFKELCMVSQTPKAKEVRKYFIEMEKLVKRYYEKMKESMYKEVGLLKANQKPKTSIKGGVIYILRALNTDATVYKIGKSGDLAKRLKTYNSGNANDIEPEFIIPVQNIHATEQCIKVSIKQFQYRKYKEVYEIDIQVLKELMEKCTEISNKIASYYEKKKAETKAKLKRFNAQEDKYFIFIEKNEDEEEKLCKCKSKTKSKTKTKPKIKKVAKKTKSKTKPKVKKIVKKSKSKN